MWRAYDTPASLDDALRLLAKHADDGVRIIAGGTDLLVELDRGTRKPCPLIDISRLPDLNTIRRDADGWLHLGPLVTHNDIVASELCVHHAFPLAQACREVGAPQIRNRATVAGNLVTASPANDTITPLMTLGAVLTLRSAHGERRVALADFYTGVRKCVLAADEMLLDIAFPGLDASAQGVYLKLGLRRAQAISVVNCAVVITREHDGRVTHARIALGAVAPVIIRATEAEQVLTGSVLDDAAIAAAAAAAERAATPISDIRAGAGYRKAMCAVLIRRALQQISEHSERAGWSTPVTLTAGHTHSCTDAENACVNGIPYAVTDGAAHKTVLRWLREDCELTGTKEGCAEGECGACTVLLDGKAVMACLVPAPRALGANIETVESLAQGRQLHPLQQAFIDHAAVQCGYCIPGLLMSGAALMRENAAPNDIQIKESISGNLCRCTGYYKILEAMRAATDLKLAS